jgi:hypothetical protein
MTLCNEGFFFIFLWDACECVKVGERKTKLKMWRRKFHKSKPTKNVVFVKYAAMVPT